MSVIMSKLTLFKRFPKPFFYSFPKYQSNDSSDSTDYERQRIPFCLVEEHYPPALYGGRHTVSMLPGTGVGPEVCSYVRTVFKKLGAPVDFEVVEIDAKSDDFEEFTNALVSVKRNGAAIKGNIQVKTDDSNYKLYNILLYKELKLYVYVMWCKSYPCVPAKHENIDIVVIRQNIEGEYSMLEHSIDSKVVETLKIVRKDESFRLAQFAYEYAKRFNRKKVTIVHKANIMKLSDGLFLKIAKEVAQLYPEIITNDVIVDNFCMQVIKDPRQFDVLLAPNLYGSIIGNILCGLSGGPGLMAGKNYGSHYAIFEPGIRKSATKLTGKNVANPISMINASVSLLTHLGHHEYARKLDDAIFKTLCFDKVHTPDLGGKASSTDVVNKILDHL